MLMMPKDRGIMPPAMNQYFFTPVFLYIPGGEFFSYRLY